jgi:uncharacterized protein (TIGR02646 family)
MRRIPRLPLGRKTLVWLGLRTREILTADDPRGKAGDLWRSTRRHRYRREVHATLLRMTSGAGRCMYCEDSAGHQVDHRWPQSRHPERTFCWDNLLLACARCNGHKLAQFPLDEHNRPLLIDPTAEDPGEHLVHSHRQGMILVKDGSPKGTATIDVLKLNRWELVRGRQGAWVSLQSLLGRYHDLRVAERNEAAERLKSAICGHPFSALLDALLAVLDLPIPEPYLEEPDRLQALRALAPEIRRWLASA